MWHRPLNQSGCAASKGTGGVESDSEDRGSLYGDGNKRRGAAPGAARQGRGNSAHGSRTEQDRRRIDIQDQTVLCLTFWGRGKRWRAHSGPLHWTGFFLFHEQRRTSHHREIGQGAHRADHLAQDEEECQSNVCRIHSSNHGVTLFLKVRSLSPLSLRNGNKHVKSARLTSTLFSNGDARKTGRGV